jgi:hypothetical protein
VELNHFYPAIEGAYVNTKKWYRKKTDLWAELGKEISFGRRFFLKAFGKGACGRDYGIVRQKDCFAPRGGSIQGRIDDGCKMDTGAGTLFWAMNP